MNGYPGIESLECTEEGMSGDWSYFGEDAIFKILNDIKEHRETRFVSKGAAHGAYMITDFCLQHGLIAARRNHFNRLICYDLTELGQQLLTLRDL